MGVYSGEVLVPEKIVNAEAAAVLEGAMKESKLVQKSLASGSGLSVVTVQKLLSGNQSIKVHQFLALASATKLTPAQIMQRVDEAVARAVAASEATDSTESTPEEQAAEFSDEQVRQLELRQTDVAIAAQGTNAETNPKQDRDPANTSA